MAAFLPPACQLPSSPFFLLSCHSMLHGTACSAAFLYWHRLSSVVLVVQVVLYLTGAVAFLRNGGHDRWGMKGVVVGCLCSCIPRACEEPLGRNNLGQGTSLSSNSKCTGMHALCRWTGLTDHHFLHYFVTAATSLHVWHLLRAEEAQ
jgi:hypothetical protein